MTNSLGKIFQGSFFIFVIGLFSAILAFFIRIILAKNLSVEEYGLFYAVFVFVSFFALFRNFGLGASMIKHVPEFKAKGNLNLIKSTIFITSSIRILISLVFAFSFYFLSDFLANNYFHNSEASIILKLLSIFFFVSVFIDITRNLFESFQKPFLFPFVDFLKNGFILIFILVFFSLGLGVFTPVFAYLSMAIFIPIIFFPFILRLFDFSKYKSNFSQGLIKKFFLFGLPFVFVSLSAVVVSQVDTLLLTYFRSLKEVGIYNVVLPVSLLLLQLSSAISVVLYPLCSEYWAKKDIRNLISIIKEIYKYSIMFVLPIGLILFVFASPLLKIFFGEQYVAGASAMKVLIIGVIFYTLANVNHYILAGIGRPKITAKIILTVAIFNFMGNIILIPYLGILGAAIITTVSYILSLLMSTIYLKKYLDLEIEYLVFFKLIIAGVIIFFIVGFFANIESFFEIILTSIFVLGIYFILLFVFRIFLISKFKIILRKYLSR